MPDIAVLVGIFNAVKDSFYSIVLIWTQRHQAFVAFVQHDILTDHFAETAFFQKMTRKFFQIIERSIFCVCPIKSELVTAVGIISKIAGVNAIRYHEKLYV